MKHELCHVGEHVTGIRKQCETAGQPTRDELCQQYAPVRASAP
jgi:hypothetical protein